MDRSVCPAFSGNPDFYGAGIRLGVYLQVLSSWILNSFNAEATADTHDANSIFLLAIIIAVANAASGHEIRPVELWIMLQTCLMFPLTVLGVFGARTNFLSPESVEKLFTRLWQLSFSVSVKGGAAGASLTVGAEVSRYDRDVSDEIVILEDETIEHRQWSHSVGAPDLSIDLGMASIGLNLSFKALSLLKQSALTWTGAIWRTLILLSVAATNLWFWFSFWDQTPCRYSVFLLDKIHPDRAIAQFFQAGAVLFAVAAAVPLLISICLVFIIVRYVVSLLVNKTKDTPSLSEAMEAFVYFSSKGSQDEHEKEHNKTVSVENAQKRGVHISPDGFSGLGSFVGKTTTHEYRATLNNRQSSRKYSWMASITLHILTVLAIAYFILSIELTISWNRITGVYNIKSTGQLIPFIIGVVSSTRAAQQVILGILRKKYSNVENLDFEVSLGFNHGQGLRLIKRTKPLPKVFRIGRVQWDSAAVSHEPVRTLGQQLDATTADGNQADATRDSDIRTNGNDAITQG